MNEEYEISGDESTELLKKEALRFYDMGWTIIPVAGKKSTIAWTKWQEARPDRKTVIQWFSQPVVTGIGVIHKDRICCRDFDNEPAYDAWKTEYPDLAATLPTCKTSRGYHVYFLSDAKYKRYPDGELIADRGHYSVLPPSIHESGVLYQWVVPLSRLTEQNPDFFQKNEGVTHRHHSEVSEASDESDASVNNIGPSDEIDQKTLQIVNDRGLGMGEKILSIIKATIPTALGQRHNKIFHLAASLKHLGLTLKACKPYFDQWFKLSKDNMRENDKAFNYGEFQEAWHNYDPGRAGFRMAVESAKLAEPIPLDPDYMPEVEMLARICRELSNNGKRQFFLSTHTAGKYLNKDPKQISRWLSALCADELIDRKSKGSVKDRKAGEYEWIAGRNAIAPEIKSEPATINTAAYVEAGDFKDDDIPF